MPMYDQTWCTSMGDLPFLTQNLLPRNENNDILTERVQMNGMVVSWLAGPTKVDGWATQGVWAPKPEQQAVAEFLENTEAVDTFRMIIKQNCTQL